MLVDIRRTRFGKDSTTALSLDMVVDQLDIPLKLKAQLASLTQALENTGYLMLNEMPSPNTPVQGRGITLDIDMDKKLIPLYLKGVGSARALSLNDSPLGAFGEINGTIFHDDPELAELPRINGALYLKKAAVEFYHTLRFMTKLIQDNNYESLQQLTDNGVPIPIRITAQPGIKDYILSNCNTRDREVMERSSDEMDFVTLSLITPSKSRFSNVFDYKTIADIDYDGPDCPYVGGPRIYTDNDQTIPKEFGKTLRKMLEMNVIFEGHTRSGHSENIYFAQHSVFPFADLGDTIPVHNYKKESIENAFSSQLRIAMEMPLMPVASAISIREAIFTGLFQDSSIAYHYARDFTDNYNIASEIAKELIHLSPKDTTTVDPAIISEVLNAEEYQSMIAKKIKNEESFHIREQGVKKKMAEWASPNPPMDDLLKPYKHTGFLAHNHSITQIPPEEIYQLK